MAANRITELFLKFVCITNRKFVKSLYGKWFLTGISGGGWGARVKKCRVSRLQNESVVTFTFHCKPGEQPEAGTLVFH